MSNINSNHTFISKNGKDHTKDSSIKNNLEFDFSFIEEPVKEITLLQEIKDKANNPRNIGYFVAKSANEWMDEAKNRPIPKMLFSEFFYEQEICILFSDTNMGKSILAVQIADSISTGIPIDGFKMEAQKQKVLYFDFELSDKQFQNRYSFEYNNNYKFDDNFIRIEINPDAEIKEDLSYEEIIKQAIEGEIKKSNAKVLIIDNITYLKGDNEKAKDALLLMKYLKQLKNKYKLSLLVLAHTPKRDQSKQINLNDLQGSKMLMNFCDSSFAIGQCSQDKSMKYLKQVKTRNSEMIYNYENVCIFEVCKKSNFLKTQIETCYGQNLRYILHEVK